MDGSSFEKASAAVRVLKMPMLAPPTNGPSANDLAALFESIDDDLVGRIHCHLSFARDAGSFSDQNSFDDFSWDASPPTCGIGAHVSLATEQRGIPEPSHQIPQLTDVVGLVEDPRRQHATDATVERRNAFWRRSLEVVPRESPDDLISAGTSLAPSSCNRGR